MSAALKPAAPRPGSERLFTPILVAGALILAVGFGIRGAFGLFQIPIAETFGWPRAEYSLAIAIQNLAWGFGQPAFAAIADRWGPRPALLLGIFTYALGLLGSAFAMTAEGHQLLNMIIGFGVAGTGFGVVLGMVGKAASDNTRSLALGIATAAGSAGQFLLTPVAGLLLEAMPWQQVFVVFAGMAMTMVLFLPLLRGLGSAAEAAAGAVSGPSMSDAVRRAARDPSYILIFLGFFSCGYQLGFITAHFPAFIAETCAPIAPGGILDSLGVDSPAALGAWAIGLIGVMNIGGTLLAGKLGATLPKKYLLSTIYALRTAISAWFILTPMTAASVLIFSGVMGALWLATVPLTAGLVGVIHGLRFMGTLYGFVFLSHQIGAFLGVFLGGALYDRYGSYDTVWWVGVGAGAFSMIVHLPVRERPIDAGDAGLRPA